MGELGDDAIVSVNDRRKEFRRKLDSLIMDYNDIGKFTMLDELETQVRNIKQIW